jgi:cell filamentation protein
MKPTLVDSQFDERNGVLKNKLNAVDPAGLMELAADFATMRLSQLLVKPVPGKFDIAHLRAIHKYIFQDVFPWAGDFREVTTSRTNSFGFPPPQFLVPSLETIFAALKVENHLKGLTADAFALRAGHCLGEINAVHPFREGNGRTQREFIRTLARQAGHRLTWAGLTPEENNEASRVSYATGDSAGLAALIRKRLG